MRSQAKRRSVAPNRLTMRVKQYGDADQAIAFALGYEATAAASAISPCCCSPGGDVYRLLFLFEDQHSSFRFRDHSIFGHAGQRCALLIGGVFGEEIDRLNLVGVFEWDFFLE